MKNMAAKIHHPKVIIYQKDDLEKIAKTLRKPTDEKMSFQATLRFHSHAQRIWGDTDHQGSGLVEIEWFEYRYGHKMFPGLRIAQQRRSGNGFLYQTHEQFRWRIDTRDVFYPVTDYQSANTLPNGYGIYGLYNSPGHNDWIRIHIRPYHPADK